MTNEEISYILSLIDQWVSQIEQHQLNEQCRWQRSIPRPGFVGDWKI